MLQPKGAPGRECRRLARVGTKRTIFFFAQSQIISIIVIVITIKLFFARSQIISIIVIACTQNVNISFIKNAVRLSDDNEPKPNRNFAVRQVYARLHRDDPGHRGNPKAPATFLCGSRGRWRNPNPRGWFGPVIATPRRNNAFFFFLLLSVKLQLIYSYYRTLYVFFNKYNYA